MCPYNKLLLFGAAQTWSDCPREKILSSRQLVQTLSKGFLGILLHSVKLRRDSCADDAGDCAESRQHAKNADSQHHRRGAISGHGSCGCHENCRHSSTGRNLKWCSSQLRLWAGRAKECHTANCHECNKCNAQRNQLGWAGHGWAFCNIDSQNATHTWTTNSAHSFQHFGCLSASMWLTFRELVT